jgi:hypothetical protein
MLENIMIFFKVLTLIFISKYFQRYCRKPNKLHQLMFQKSERIKIFLTKSPKIVKDFVRK